MSCERFSWIDEWNGEKIGAPDPEVRTDDSYSVNVKRWLDDHRNIDRSGDW